MGRRNRHLIVGTAGHVDHGKTELVRVLTGVNTDRLKEEQERGISIELGFAPMTLPGGDTLGLVDVPGHERFVKAMVAGAAGMDLGLLVVAADESVMPQTREHLDIMVLLGLRGGAVAITKCDLADEVTLDVVQAEIEDLVRGTFLEGAPVVRTSARTRCGLDELLAALDELSARLPPKPTDTFFRLPVDRAFVLSGVGLVVTGTAWSGRVREGDTVEVLPPERQARVRSLQVHGDKRSEAFAGERVAMNLHGLKPEEVERGMLVASPGMLQPSYMLDVNLQLLPGFERPLRNRTRVRVHHGAAEVLGRVVLLDREELSPGETTFAQLRLEEPLAAERGDPVVLRFYSPMRTLGGARVLEAAPAKHKRYRAEVLREMHLKESGSPSELLHDAIRRAGIAGLSADELRRARIVEPGAPGGQPDAGGGERAGGDALNAGAAGRSAGGAEPRAGGEEADALERSLGALLASGEIVRVGEVYYDTAVLDRAAGEVRRLAEAHQRVNRLAWGIGRAELQERLGHRASRARFGELLEHLAAQSSGDAAIHLRPDAVRAGGAERELSEADRSALARLEAALRTGGAAPPTVPELQKELELGTRFPAFAGLLEERGAVVKVTESLLYHREALDEIDAKLRAFLSCHDVMSMAEFKELTGLSRKYAVPLLEYFDRRGVTARSGDVRRPGPVVREHSR